MYPHLEITDIIFYALFYELEADYRFVHQWGPSF